jgi:hypothetical protein
MDLITTDMVEAAVDRQISMISQLPKRVEQPFQLVETRE